VLNESPSRRIRAVSTGIRVICVRDLGLSCFGEVFGQHTGSTDPFAALLASIEVVPMLLDAVQMISSWVMGEIPVSAAWTTEVAEQGIVHRAGGHNQAADLRRGPVPWEAEVTRWMFSAERCVLLPGCPCSALAPKHIQNH